MLDVVRNERCHAVIGRDHRESGNGEEEQPSGNPQTCSRCRQQTATSEGIQVALTLCFLLTLGGRLQAQSSAGVASAQPPEEDAYVYKQVPDVQIMRTGNGPNALGRTLAG